MSELTESTPSFQDKVEQEKDKILEGFFQLLRFSSISTEPEPLSVAPEPPSHES